MIPKDPEQFLNMAIAVYTKARADALDLVYQRIDEALMRSGTLAFEAGMAWVRRMLAHAVAQPDLPEALRQCLLTACHPWGTDLATELGALRTRTDAVRRPGAPGQAAQLELTKEEVVMLKHLMLEIEYMGEPLKNFEDSVYGRTDLQAMDKHAVKRAVLAKIADLKEP